MADTRQESDAMGPVGIPNDHRYGASTARAMASPPISGGGVPREVVCALAAIKGASAEVNSALGLLPPEIVELVIAAGSEVVDRGCELAPPEVSAPVTGARRDPP